MSINTLIKDAESNHQKWQSIVSRGTWQQHNKTEIQALLLRERFEGMLDGLTEAKQLMRVGV